MLACSIPCCIHTWSNLDTDHRYTDDAVSTVPVWAPESSVSEEIADIFRNYNIDSKVKGMKFPVEFWKWISNFTLHFTKFTGHVVIYTFSGLS